MVLTEARVLTTARQMTVGARSTGNAAAAYDYGREVGGGIDVDDCAVVLAWVFLSLPAVGSWPGRVAEMRDAIDSLYGGNAVWLLR
jgi:hypothetical protein